jgi:hypothetical protein
MVFHLSYGFHRFAVLWALKFMVLILWISSRIALQFSLQFSLWRAITQINKQEQDLKL